MTSQNEVMKKHKVVTNDLYAKTKSFSPVLFVRPGDVHYTEEGYKRIARQVAEQILTAIGGEQPGASNRRAAGD